MTFPLARRSIPGVLTAAVFLAGCESAPPSLAPISELTEHDSPAGPGSSWPFLSADEKGSVYMTWLEPEDPDAFASASTHRGAFRLRMAARSNGGWSEPSTIARGEHFFVNWADFPSVVPLPDGTLAAHWLGNLEEAPGEDYGFFLALSRDGGHTWSEPRAAGPNGIPRGHFPALFPWEGSEGVLAAVWLDRPGAAEGRPDADPGAPMTLRHAVFDEEGRVVEEKEIDPSVCDCCQIGVAATPEGVVVVYRGRSDTEVRDITVVRLTDDGWTLPRPVHDDGWTIPACPVNGPSIAAEGDRVVVAWFTGADDEPRVHVAFSEDAGASFGEPHRVDEGNPLGRVDVSLLPDGTALVSWLERGTGAAEIRVRRFTAEGDAGPFRSVATSTEERVSGFPRMIRNGSELLFAWTDPGEPGAVRVAGAEIPGGGPQNPR